MTTSEVASVPANAEALTGRLAEYQELINLLPQRPGLTVVSADPWSGTSDLLATVADVMPEMVVADARRASDRLDLAMVIADAAVARFAPEATSWWMGTDFPKTSRALHVARALQEVGIDEDNLRFGSGRADDRFGDAIELVVALGDDRPVLAIDHFGTFLASLTKRDARAVLGDLRSLRQERPNLDLVLVEHQAGPISAAIRDEAHPLYHAGGFLRLRRPEPDRFAADLAITRPWTDVPVELLRSAAALVEGVPRLTWRVVELAVLSKEDDVTLQAHAGWLMTRKAAALSVERNWDLLRRVHPVAQAVVAALALQMRPHEVAAAPKSVNDALTRLRDLGITWQPRPRQWALADPLVAAWTRDNSPPWAMRRRPMH